MGAALGPIIYLISDSPLAAVLIIASAVAVVLGVAGGPMLADAMRRRRESLDVEAEAARRALRNRERRERRKRARAKGKIENAIEAADNVIQFPRRGRQ